ncbi:hypothetical protein C7212DRAFT_345241 [Tuber magnatum]|uniref:Uncharacterized protein n=1 Tax=Tuber magnatum TaxID=42249 RepID=A0A317SQR6_9PEZI|nr:hypothetical protein C7212DRAFT_345241 [Tuber magnatum]
MRSSFYRPCLQRWSGRRGSQWDSVHIIDQLVVGMDGPGSAGSGEGSMVPTATGTVKRGGKTTPWDWHDVAPLGAAGVDTAVFSMGVVEGIQWTGSYAISPYSEIGLQEVGVKNGDLTGVTDCRQHELIPAVVVWGEDLYGETMNY